MRRGNYSRIAEPRQSKICVISPDSSNCLLTSRLRTAYFAKTARSRSLVPIRVTKASTQMTTVSP